MKFMVEEREIGPSVPSAVKFWEEKPVLSNPDTLENVNPHVVTFTVNVESIPIRDSVPPHADVS